MTRIEYDEKNLRLKLSGHTGYPSRKGENIVCAAVSILAETLLQNLENFRDRGWYELEYQYGTPGEMEIHCTVRGYYSMVVEMFRFVMVGMRMIAEEYPQHVKVIETGGTEDGGV